MPFGLDFFVAVDGILLVPSFGTRRVVLVVVVAAVIMAIQFLFRLYTCLSTADQNIFYFIF